MLVFVLSGLRDYVKHDIYLGNSATIANDFAGQTDRIKMLFSLSGLVDVFWVHVVKIFI